MAISIDSKVLKEQREPRTRWLYLTLPIKTWGKLREDVAVLVFRWDLEGLCIPTTGANTWQVATLSACAGTHEGDWQ
jgi:hypothetical protein